MGWKGLSGRTEQESIPVLSRVIVVVDAFDAMVSDRPYRNGMPVSDALEELKNAPEHNLIRLLFPSLFK